MRRAFTLVELIVVLAVIAATSLLGLHLAQSIATDQAESQFFTAFEHHWTALWDRGKAADQASQVQLLAHAVVFDLLASDGHVTNRFTLAMPESVTPQLVGLTISRPRTKLFSDAQQLVFNRSGGRQRTYSVHVGWGVLMKR